MGYTEPEDPLQSDEIDDIDLISIMNEIENSNNQDVMTSTQNTNVMHQNSDGTMTATHNFRKWWKEVPVYQSSTIAILATFTFIFTKSKVKFVTKVVQNG